MMKDARKIALALALAMGLAGQASAALEIDADNVVALPKGAGKGFSGNISNYFTLPGRSGAALVSGLWAIEDRDERKLSLAPMPYAKDVDAGKRKMMFVVFGGGAKEGGKAEETEVIETLARVFRVNVCGEAPSTMANGMDEKRFTLVETLSTKAAVASECRAQGKLLVYLMDAARTPSGELIGILYGWDEPETTARGREEAVREKAYREFQSLNPRVVADPTAGMGRLPGLPENR